MTRYHHALDPDTSYGSALRLVERSARSGGVVLDVGCGYGAVAEPLTEAGFTYVGVDVDRASLDDLSRRGHEAHQLSLLLPEQELADALATIVSGRIVGVVLALDVLEHLLDVPATLRALATVAAPSQAELVVSYPNVTHYDVGAKLLLGRWDTTDEGLLDRTHTQFVSGPDLPAMFAGAGWRQVDQDDVIRQVSDQCFPSYAPPLRIGSPARELLWSWRRQADAFGSTFQFVRRFVPAPAEAPTAPVVLPDEERPFATVVAVLGGDQVSKAADEALLADLAAQSLPPAQVVEVVAGSDGDRLRALNEAFAAAEGRYLLVARSGDRLATGWLAAFAAVEAETPGMVLRASGVGLGPARASATVGQPFAELVEGADPLDAAVLDPVHVAEPCAAVPPAIAIPAAVVQVMGIRLESSRGDAAFDVLAAEAAVRCGVQPVDEVVVAVPEGSLPDPRLVEGHVTDALSRNPLLLRAGDAARLADLRARVGRGDLRLGELSVEASARARQIEALSTHVHELGAEADQLRRERDHWRTVAQRKPTVQLRALLSKALRRLDAG